jgi:SNF2 family DNA or RNA helicase
MVTDFLQNDSDLIRALLYIYAGQTAEEQSIRETYVSNGIGFNAVDAEFLSSVSQQILDGRTMTEKQIHYIRLRLGKYHNQLADGNWKNIILPEATAKGKPKSIATGTLSLDNAVGLKFTPNIYPSKQIKSIGFTFWSGGAWHQAKPHITMQIVNDLKKMFGDIAIDEAVIKAVTPTEVKLPELISDHEQLFPFQKETIKFSLTNKHVLISLAPGLGKTACGIFAAQAAGCKSILVISPLSLLYNWRNEIKKWVSEDAVIWYQKNLPIPSKWVITNYDTLRLHPKQFEKAWDCIIIDETILIKNRKAQRSKVVAELVKASAPKYVFELSGAPVSKMYTDMWSQLTVLDPNRFSSFWRFAERYCVVESNQWSKYNLVANKPDAGKQIVEDLADIYFARSQEDVLELPEFIFEDIHIPMTKEQDKLYGQMEEEFMADLSEDDRLLAPNVLTQLLRLVQFASNPTLVGGIEKSSKWDACIEMLEFEQPPFIVWTNFIATAEKMVERIREKGYTAEKLTGATPIEERQAIVDAFQGSKLDVIVAHPAVGKFGLTLTAARTAIYLERGYNADDYYQSLYRVKRIGTKFSPHILHLISDRAGGGSTIDSTIGKILEGRKSMVESITNMGLKEMILNSK